MSIKPTFHFSHCHFVSRKNQLSRKIKFLLLSIMEKLSEDLLITITKKVAATGTRNLLNFKATSVNHRRLANKKTVFRALPRSCVWYFYDHFPSTEKLAFMRRMIQSGHESFSLVEAARLLYEEPNNLNGILCILRKAASHGVEGAKYLLMILKILSKDGFSMEEVFPIFKDLFDRQMLAECRRSTCGGPGFPYFLPHRPHRGVRPLPPGLVIRFTCVASGECKGHGRKPGIFWPLPGSDNEYYGTELCLYCRLDLEVKWFLHEFHFLEIEGF